MQRVFYDDPFLYRSIKEVTNLNDSEIEPIFKKLHAQEYWNIGQIEEEANKYGTN